MAANYLDIKGLLDVCSQTVANMIMVIEKERAYRNPLLQGKTPEEIRHTFNIADDFSAEEREQIRTSYQWSEE